jgi:hypothetical protein
MFGRMSNVALGGCLMGFALFLVLSALSTIVAACQNLTSDESAPIGSIAQDVDTATTTTVLAGTSETSATDESTPHTTGSSLASTTTSSVAGTTTSSSVVTSTTLSLLEQLQGQLQVEQAAIPSWTRFEETDSRLLWQGVWSTWTNSACSGGKARRAITEGGGTAMWFEGTRVRFITVTRSDNGIARVHIDHEPVVWVDLYGTSISSKTAWTSGVLSPGQHFLIIEWSGQKNPASSGYCIVFDAVEVIGTLIQAGP